MTDVDLPDQTVFTPRHIGAYRIDGELGTGAMGAVFRAMHTGLERAVALKVLRPDLLQDADSVRRFLREARSIARLDHPNIVAVYDAGEYDGVHYIAMKLLEGRTLQALLAETGPLPASRTITFGHQLASALDYAHSHDVVHLDVKPANVIVGQRNHATLTDFSIAQALNPEATRTAAIAGTPLYMSPEQIQAQDPDSRSDIYSLGLLLYEMCAGRPPFQGQFVSVMYAHLHEPIPDLRETAPGVPDDLVAVIDRALEKDREKRFQTAGEMLRALEHCAAFSEAEVASTVVLEPREGREGFGAIVAGPEVPPAERPARVLWLGAAAAVLVVLAVIAGILFSRRSTAQAPGSLSVASIPVHATLVIDGRRTARTPFHSNHIPAGVHHVALSAPSYASKRVRIDISPGKPFSLRLTLQSLPAYKLVYIEQAYLLRTRGRGAGGQLIPNGVLHSIRVAQARRQVFLLTGDFRVRAGVPPGRVVAFHPNFTVNEPDGLPISSIQNTPVLTLSRKRPSEIFSAAIRLKIPNSLNALGTYTLNISIDSTPARILRFRVTP